MRRRPLVTSLWLALLALGGLLTGHLASYFVVAPDAHERAELLALTGHSQHSGFGTAAAAATCAAVIALIAQRLDKRRASTSSDLSRIRIVMLLVTAQIVGFTALEVWERGHGVLGATELLHEPAFLVGLVAQVVAACLATAIVGLVRASVDALLRLLVRPSGDRAPFPFTASTSRRAPGSVARAAWNLRGPPLRAPSPH
jgi:hypothetical protein